MTSDQSWEKLSDKAAPSPRGSAASGEEEEAAAPLPCSPSIASRMLSPDFQSHRLDKWRGASVKRWLRGGGRRYVTSSLLLFARTLP